MKFSFVTASLKEYERDKSIIVYATDGDKVHSIRVKGFLFHFFVRADEFIPDHEHIVSIEDGYVHEDGFPLKKINVSHSKYIKPLRNLLKEKYNVETYEADIPSIRRFKIDTKIFNDFEIDSPNFSVVHYTHLKPTSVESYHVKKVYVDFEIRTKTRFPDPRNPDQPCTAWCAWSSTDRIYYQAVLKEDLEEDHVTEWITDDWCCVWCKTEKTLLRAFEIFLRSHQPYVIVHYNGKVADIGYPIARARLYNIDLPYDESDECDLCLAYQTLYKRLYNRLKDIAIEEGIFEPHQLVAEEFHGNIEKEDIRKFGAYNKLDVEILVTLDQLGWMRTNLVDGTKSPEPARQIVDFFWELRNFIGLESIDAALHSGVLVDTLMLRKAYEKGIVLNSSHEKDEGKKYSGAIIFSPPPGLYEYMQLLDMSRYYPNIILGYKIDSLACEVVTDLMARREEIEAEQKKHEPDSPPYILWEKKLNMVKFTTNATYGYMGSPRSRKYVREKAAKITEKARLGLITIREAVEARTPELLKKLNEHTGFNHGFPVLYCHTDSIGIQASREEIKKLVWYLNDVILKEHCIREGIPHLLKLKHEKEARRAIFVEAKNKKGSAKAHYAMWITYEKGQPADYIDIVGLDYVRGNASKITRKLQMSILRWILKNNTWEIKPYLQKLIKDIKSGKYTLSEMAIPITLRCDPEDYAKKKTKDGKKKSIPDFARAAIWSKRNLGIEIVGGDRIKIIPVTRVIGKEPTDLIAFFDEENINSDLHIDYDKVIKKTVQAKAEQFLSVVGITWDEIIGVEKLNGWRFQ